MAGLAIREIVLTRRLLSFSIFFSASRFSVGLLLSFSQANNRSPWWSSITRRHHRVRSQLAIQNRKPMNRLQNRKNYGGEEIHLLRMRIRSNVSNEYPDNLKPPLRASLQLMACCVSAKGPLLFGFLRSLMDAAVLSRKLGLHSRFLQNLGSITFSSPNH